MFFKEPNTGYAEYVFRWSDITKMTMERFYPLIKTPPYLTAMPEITQRRRMRHDCFLVMASDGLWGLKPMTNKWVVEKTHEGINRGLNAAEYLMAEVLKFRPGDDVTIIVVVFSNDPPKQAEIGQDKTSST
jgi:serine/threonine protein phosphatase PrpC